MILDHLDNWHLYAAMNGDLAKAFAFLRRDDLADLPDGRHEVDGEKLYAVVLRKEGLGRDGVTLEAHRRYLDIQFCLRGGDEIGWKPTSQCSGETRGFDEANDLELFSDKPDTWLSVKPGAFAIFFPSDAHAPMGGVGPMHKVVVKIALEQ